MHSSDLQPLPETTSQITCTNPATGQVIGHVPTTDMSQVPQMFEKARAAQKRWSQYSFKERRRYILQMRDYIVEHADELTHTISQSTGKSLNDALVSEVFSSICAADWYAKKAKKYLSKRSIFPSNILFANKRSYLLREPLGVVGIIAPWNYPFAIPFGEIVMGLMAGNAVFYKVAEETALVAPMMEKIIAAARLPEGLCQLMIGDPPKISESWFEQRIDKIFFTGSVRVGKLLMQQSAKTLTPISMELGGNDAMIVFPDANLERAANGAIWAGFQNSGQTCAGVERVYVHEDTIDEFLTRLQEKTENLRQGVETGSSSVDVGSMTTPRQLETVKSHVDDALEKGAKVVAQATVYGQSVKNFFPATVLTDVNHDMAIMREETFGPVIAVMPFKYEDEVIAFANDSEYGLTSSVWTMDKVLGQRVAQKLETGITTINDHLYTHALSELPWMGWKNSGLGATHSHLGLEEMTKVKLINYDLAPSINKNLWWFPAHPAKYEIFLETGRLLFGKSAKQRTDALMKLLPKIIKDPLLIDKLVYLFKRVENKGRRSIAKNIDDPIRNP